ncbi:MAG: hypothetical protein EGR15_03210 [Lachnospiraceae bacterium]|nr:hypothetical protein [Lachnospiraceae bacterium]
MSGLGTRRHDSVIRKNLAKALSFCLLTGWIACHTNGVTALAEETDRSMTGELAFAQCEEYINIRKEPDENSEIVAKIYNDNAATIISRTGDWYQVTSGNAFGYVKADYLVTGDEASAIAEKVQYHIARVHPEELYIRSEKSEDSTAVGSVHQADELDAVSYDNGAWIQVVAEDGTEGYINAYYADYLTCYPVAETLEEEQDRLKNQSDSSEAASDGSGQGAIYGVEKAAEYTEPVSYDSGSSSDMGSAAEAGGSQDNGSDTSEDTSWDNSSDISDDTTWSDTSDGSTVDSTEFGDSYTESDSSTSETDGTYSEPDNSYTEPSVPETDASYTEPETNAPETDAPYTEPETSAPETDAPYMEPETSAPETDAPYTEPETSVPETDAPYTEPETSVPETDAPYTEPETSAPETEAPEPEAPAPEDTSSSSDLGQQIASYAVQFVGNPYVYGGTSLTNGADCSGFVQSVFANFGIGLSRTAASQAGGGTSVSLDSLQAGDLLFYSSSGSIDHVALYIGGGQIVHAANSASGIIISNAYYSTPVAARRYW